MEDATQNIYDEASENLAAIIAASDKARNDAYLKRADDFLKSAAEVQRISREICSHKWKNEWRQVSFNGPQILQTVCSVCGEVYHA